MVIISIPTVFDPSLAPEGYHVVHAYTAASDSFDDWLPFLDDKKESGKVGSNPNLSTASKYSQSDEYKELKEKKAEALWRAVEQVIPDVHERAKRRGNVVLIGMPLTHCRYNHRFREPTTGTRHNCSQHASGCSKTNETYEGIERHWSLAVK